MNKGRRIIYSAISIIAFVAACSSQRKTISPHQDHVLADLKNSFLKVPDTIQTSVYWYWMSDNISKEGVVKDLYAMKKIGINRAFIGNIGLQSTAYGKVKLLSEEWWSILDTALLTATKLNIEIGIFNSPGWSQSGGPWIKPEQSMRYLTFSEQRLKGGQKISTQLVKPDPQFQDVKVIAFKAPLDYGIYLSALKPTVKTSIPISAATALVDGDRSNPVKIPAQQSIHIDVAVEHNFLARSLVIYPAHFALKAHAELQVKDGAHYRTLKTFEMDRSNPSLNVGFDPYGPISVSFPEVSAKEFRLVLSQASTDFALTEIELSASPVVEDFIGKTLAKMFQSPLPYWKEYQWKPQAEASSKNLVIDPAGVIDVSSGLSVDGILTWDFPTGDWIVMRTGMVPTKVTNSPASVEGTGLEVDKMSKAHILSHFDSFLGEIIRRIPAKHRKTWRVAVQDSYETGGQNWTDKIMEQFQATYGYDPLPYLPVMRGRVVGSQEMSDRFLWDLRRLIADRVAYDYVGGLRAVSNSHGLRTWLENYGHWGFPGEFLQYGGQSDEIGGEFWSEGELGNIENRAASSAAHIYGKTKVSAESFTAGGKPYARYPALMKQRGDRFFAEGINNTLLHVFIQQPTDNLVPGINADFGNEFNRHNTWFNYLDLFTSYLKRTNFLLQQGNYVADVAYFIGEDAPKMTGVTDPALPAGYSFDYINGEVLRDRVKVKDGKLVLPDGMSYSLLVLPKLETMRPELLAKIKELVEQGATILGSAPLRSPSLQGYPAADREVDRLATLLWGEKREVVSSSRSLGKGRVLQGMDMQTALNILKIVPDFKTNTASPVLYIHRKLANQDIYFVSNQTEQELTINPDFRITGRAAQLWDPITGNTRVLPAYTETSTATAIPLKLAPLQSVFIVFTDPRKVGRSTEENFPRQNLLKEIEGRWELKFTDQFRGPKESIFFDKLTDWTLSPEEKIKYYSGTVNYNNTFMLKRPAKGELIMLNLGKVNVMAKVKINGKDVGGLWTAPWELDITSALQDGENKIEISVVNTWDNRLIGDSKLPATERTTWTSVNHFKPESPLSPAGLIGPVRLFSYPVNQTH
ncbi:glycoside hydrolase family 2 [Pedobacter sp. PACM 27299]|uniref:glycosyl hydrolase n=1 Tax=Pedobacter sp. PACM 27299 TaxID=1727164 RepID=UPI000705CC00|nr:glycosyl hydrolase [Pedobacter sp. PACM 27299]ALL07925.1 glycoside hydrolase family 2 [Pedobacter sp. PACM 27299]